MPVPVTSNVFKRILSAAQLELAALAILQEWMPDYLTEMEQQMGWVAGTLTVPTNYMNRNSFDTQAAEKLPKVIAISPGIQGMPVMVGHKQYRATWQLGVGVATAHREEESANDEVKAYGAVVRKILLDKQSLGEFPGIAQIMWVGETYDDIDIPNFNQQAKAAAVHFLIDVEDVVTARNGPTEHSQPSYGQVEEVIIELEKEDIDAEL